MSVTDYFETMDYGPAPESDTEARQWLARHAGGFGHLIGGSATAPVEGALFDTFEPSTGQPLARVSQGTPADVDAAVAAARAAQPGWERLGGHGRARHLYTLARLVQRHARLLAVVEALDNGKPIRETRDIDVPLVARHFYHHAGWAQLQEREFADQQPVGVIGQIVPWNFPLLMLAWKIAPALALGNTVVLKPAEFTPLSALLFGELATQAGLPPGVLNVVTGDGRTGAALVAHADVDKIAFTGSTDVGRQIRTQTAGSGKSLTLELGGKSPFIVFDDADLDAAVEGVVDAIWFNQGQVCCAGSRLLLQEGIATVFIERLKRRMSTLRAGTPLDKSIDMGSLIAPIQLERVRALVETGMREGASCHQPDIKLPAGGSFYPPTLLTDVHPASTVATEEIFGPVLVSMTFRTPDDAVALANNTRYGLAASVWSETIGLALGIAPQLQAGVVWINATNLFDAGVGFGGYRESGYGREGGREGCYEYLKPRAWAARRPRLTSVASPILAAVNADDLWAPGAATLPGIDRTPKMFINGKQARPDGEHSLPVLSAWGRLIGEVGAGNRKDIRNAVAAARGAAAWSSTTPHRRAQALYFLAENLALRAGEFAVRLMTSTGIDRRAADAEVEASLQRLFAYGAWADKYEGAVHVPPLRGVALAMIEPMGVVGAVCPDEAPLLAFVSLLAPLLAMGNRLVIVPSERHPLLCVDFCQVLETSDLPAGVVNVVTGQVDALLPTLAAHDDVDAVWAFGPAARSEITERLSAGNLKRTLVDHGLATDWHDAVAAEGPLFLRHATQVKNIWVPYGD
jgi:aldehyde dehydrogenase (NAD+)